AVVRGRRRPRPLATMRDDHAFDATLRHFDVGNDGERAGYDRWGHSSCYAGHFTLVAKLRQPRPRPRYEGTREAGVIERENIILPGLLNKHLLQLLEFVRMLGCQIVVLRVILIQVV